MAILTATTLKQAQQEIAAGDSTMAALIARLPAAKLTRRQPPFHVLTTSIINQQLSQKAAAAIERRIAGLVPPPFTAAALLDIAPAQLRESGLSHSKISFIADLARAEQDGLLALEQLKKLSDDEVIKQLTSVRGIGTWTAEMFLMFCLRRSDVVSLKDAGLLRAARQLYGKRFRGDDMAVLQKAASKWQPWRTVGCYYLWRSLDSASQ